MKQFYYFGIVVISVLSLFLSCQKEYGDDLGVELTERKDIVLTRAQMDIVHSNNKFSFELFKHCSDMEGNKSMLISPLSVTFSLGMVDNGADGNTLKEINEVLGYKEETADELNGFCRSMLEQLVAVDPSTIISFANMAVINQALIPNLKESFKKSIEDYYQATVCNKDFGKEDIITIINQWCEKRTDGMIRDFLNQPLSWADCAHFLNAAYFKGIWNKPFKNKDTKKEKFTLTDGTKKSISMMNQTERFGCYFKNGLYSAAQIPYGNGAFNLVVILPERGKSLADTKSVLDSDQWDEINVRIHPDKIKLKLPSFETEYGTVGLKPILQTMGIKDAFTPERANFNNLISDRKFAYYLDNVLHKTKIKVDEKGSVAAAVSDSKLAQTGMGSNYIPPEPEPIEFYADHPFIYVISEISTNAILFIGQYTGE